MAHTHCSSTFRLRHPKAYDGLFEGNLSPDEPLLNCRPARLGIHPLWREPMIHPGPLVNAYGNGTNYASYRYPCFTFQDSKLSHQRRCAVDGGRLPSCLLLVQSISDHMRRTSMNANLGLGAYKSSCQEYRCYQLGKEDKKENIRPLQVGEEGEGTLKGTLDFELRGHTLRQPFISLILLREPNPPN